ncbi:hypothetical protein HRbin40_02285 [bacterium HR40]|nr:hypothetical protein HRbin40_02285 [bacterium HR40]
MRTSMPEGRAAGRTTARPAAPARTKQPEAATSLADARRRRKASPERTGSPPVVSRHRIADRPGKSVAGTEKGETSTCRAGGGRRKRRRIRDGLPIEGQRRPGGAKRTSENGGAKGRVQQPVPVESRSMSVPAARSLAPAADGGQLGEHRSWPRARTSPAPTPRPPWGPRCGFDTREGDSPRGRDRRPEGEPPPASSGALRAQARAHQRAIAPAASWPAGVGPGAAGDRPAAMGRLADDRAPGPHRVRG